MADWWTRRKVKPDINISWTQMYYFNNVYQSSTPRTVSYCPLDTRGVDIKHFHKKKKLGQLIPHTQFEQIEVSHHILPSLYYHKLANNSEVEHRNYSFVHAKGLMLNGLSSQVDSAYANSFVQSAAAEIVNAGWDAGTFVGEIPSLKRQFTNVAKTMKRLYRQGSYDKVSKAWRRRNKNDSVSFDQAWLEGRYGWRTLAYDVRDLNDAIRNYDEKRKIWTERKGYSYTVENEATVNDVWSAGTLSANVIDITTHSVRGAVAAAITPARFIVDPLQTAWELTPYSFVVDWVLSVGDALAAQKLRYFSSAHTASIGVHSQTLRNVLVDTTPKAGCLQTYDESYVGTYTKTNRSPTNIPTLPTFTGRKLSSDLVLDLRALVKGGKTPYRR